MTAKEALPGIPKPNSAGDDLVPVFGRRLPTRLLPALCTISSVVSAVSRRRRNQPRSIPILTGGPSLRLSEEEQRAILSVADALIGRAGRTTLVMALRGSRAQRVLQFGAERTKGHGFYAGVPEPEVLARVDALIARRILTIEYADGFPLLGYTAQGLELAESYVADAWFEIVRSQLDPVRRGDPPALPFLMSAKPTRNHDTVFKVIERVGREADASWLPLLRAWSAVETRRARERLARVIAALQRGPEAPR